MIEIESMDLRRFGETQRESAETGEKIADAAGVLQRLHDARSQNLFARQSRLQKGAGRWPHIGFAHGEQRLPPFDEGRAMVRDAREIHFLGDLDEPLHRRMIERAAAANVDIETGKSRGDDDVEGLCLPRELICQCAGGGKRLIHRRRQYGAGLDLDKFMRARLHETDLHPAMRRGARVKSCAAAAFAMRVNEIADSFDGQARMPNGLDEKPALPGPIRRVRQRLHGAAAAGAVIRTDRQDAVRARRQDFDEMAALAIDFRDDIFASQRIRHEDRAARAPRLGLRRARQAGRW